MMKIKKPKIDPTKIGLNPLIANGFEIPVRVISNPNSYKVGGDDSGVIFIPDESQLEQESITKVYTKASHRLWIAQLSSPAQRLYLWLLYEAEYGLDYIWINVPRYMEENNISSVNTYKKAVDELTKFIVIYPVIGYKHVYWISPRLFFSGNRIKKYPDHIVQV